MKDIYKKYEKEYGYTPSFRELWGYYTDGELDLTDGQEYDMNKQAEALGII